MNATDYASTPAAIPTELLTFSLGGENYGMDIQKVQEIRGCDAVTTIPNAPAFIHGVVNLRGTIVPIIDMRVRLNLAETAENATRVVIVLHTAGRVVGLMVDAVSDVLALAPEQFRPAPAFCSGVDTGYLAGMGALEGGMLLLVDIEKLVDGSDMTAIDTTVH